MAFEFIARNGVIARSNSEITGSLKVTAGITGSLLGTSSFSTTASYAATASFVLGGVGSNITIADEGTSQGAATFLNFIGNAVTATVTSNTASLTISTGSSVASIAGTTNEILVNGVTTAQAGAVTLSLPQSVDLGASSGLFATSITASFISASAGFTGSLTASFLQGAITNTQLQNSSVTIGNTAISLGATATTITGITSFTSTNITGSTISASNHISGGSIIATRGLTGSLTASSLIGDIILGTQTSGSFVSTLTQGNSITITNLTAEGSNPTIAVSDTITGNKTFTDNVIIQGNLTAQQFIVSSSVYFTTTSFSSGSTIFGNDNVDIHQFTGSVRILGSLTGSIIATNGIISASSLSSTTQGVITQTINGVATNTNITNLQTTSNVQFAQITGSIISSSGGITGSVWGTSSWANNATTATTATTATNATNATNTTNTAITDTTTGVGPYYLTFVSTNTGNTGQLVDSTGLTYNSTVNGLTTGQITGSIISASNFISGGQIIARTGFTGSLTASSLIGDIILGTQTSGDYVKNLGTGTGVTIGSNTGEGSQPTIAVNYGSTSNTAVQGNTNITLTQTAGEITITGTSAQALGGGPSYTFSLPTSINGPRIITNNLTVNGLISASYFSASFGFTGSLWGTGSWAKDLDINALTAESAIADTDTFAFYDVSVTANRKATADNIRDYVLGGVSGDITINSSGVASIAANSVALGTDTTGDYVSDVTAGAGLTKTSAAGEGQTVDLAVGAGTGITVNANDVALNFNGLSTVAIADGDEFAFYDISGTTHAKATADTVRDYVLGGVSGDITIASNGVATIAANSVALGADTSGDYVSTLTQGTGVTITGGTGEGSTPTIAIGQAVATNSDVTFNRVTATTLISASFFSASFGFTGSLWGTGSWAKDLDINALTAESAIADTDTFAFYDVSVTTNRKATADNIRDYVFAGISGDVLIDSSGVAAIQANSVVLGTDTTGNYVATLGTGTGVTIGSNTGEGSAPTITVNYGSGTNTAVQGSTTLAFAGTSGEITIDGGSSITLGSGGTVTYGLADTITGDRTFTGNITIGDNIADKHKITGSLVISGSSKPLSVAGSGSTVFDIQGSIGQLFSITDSLTGEIFAVSDISGVPILSVNSNGNTYVDGNLGLNTTSPGVMIHLENANSSYTTPASNTLPSIYAYNTNSTTGTAHSILALRTGGASGGDPFISFDISGVTGWSVGIDNSDSDKFIISSQWSGLGSNNELSLDSSGNLIVAGEMTAYGTPSDETYKENILPLNGSLEKIIKLRGVTFSWKEETDVRKMTGLVDDIGFIAQEVREVLPEIVKENENGKLSLRERAIVPLLVEAIKEQQTQIQKLIERIEKLESK